MDAEIIEVEKAISEDSQLENTYRQKLKYQAIFHGENCIEVLPNLDGQKASQDEETLQEKTLVGAVIYPENLANSSNDSNTALKASNVEDLYTMETDADGDEPPTVETEMLNRVIQEMQTDRLFMQAKENYNYSKSLLEHIVKTYYLYLISQMHGRLNHGEQEEPLDLSTKHQITEPLDLPANHQSNNEHLSTTQLTNGGTQMKSPLGKQEANDLNRNINVVGAEVAPSGISCSQTRLSPMAQQPSHGDAQDLSRQYDSTASCWIEVQTLEKDTLTGLSCNKSYSCGTCGKDFTSKHHLKRHKLIHAGKKPYKCVDCGKTFASKGALKIHGRMHAGERPFACTSCGKTFTRKIILIEHEAIHTGIKPHACSDCGKTFSQKMNLTAHKRIHTGEKPYGCTECGKTFARRGNLKRHKLTHDKPFASVERN